MHIDGRNTSIEDILLSMREVARKQCGLNVDLTVEVMKREDAIKIKTFASMTGCSVKISKKDDGYLISVTGGSCRCG